MYLNQRSRRTSLLADAIKFKMEGKILGYYSLQRFSQDKLFAVA